MKLTTILDIAGLLLLVLAASLGIFHLAGLVAALFTAGALLIGVSWLVDYSARKARK